MEEHKIEKLQVENFEDVSGYGIIGEIYNQKLKNKKFVDLFIPKEGTKEDRNLKKKMKDAASKDKVQWIYINRIFLCILTFAVSIFLFSYVHTLVIKGVYNDPTEDYDVYRSDVFKRYSESNETY